MMRVMIMKPSALKPYIKDYPQFDKVSKVNVQFAMMEFTNGDKEFVDSIMDEGDLTIDTVEQVAFMTDDELIIRMYLLN